MKRKPKTDPDMEPEYDFSKGVRGAFAEKFGRRVTAVILDPDLTDAFPDSDSVNDALRLVKAISSRFSRKAATRPSRRPKSKARAS